MQYRKLAIRVLVFSLCIAALAGIGVLVLPGASWIIAKLTGTAIATALTATLLLLSIKTLDGNQYKTFGSVLGLLVCFIYLCSVGAIWSDSIPQLRSWDIPDKLSITAVATTGCGVLMLLGTICMANKKTYVAGATFSILWFLILCAWLINNWVFHFSSTYTEDFIYVMLPIQNYSAVFAVLLLHKSNLYKSVGLIFAISSCFIVQFMSTTTDGQVGQMPTLLAIGLVTAWLCSEMAIWNIITFRKATSALPKCEFATAFIIGLAFASFCILIWCAERLQTGQRLPELLVRVSTSFGILASTAFLGLLIGRFFRANSFLMEQSGFLRATCPRCSAALVLERGKSKCPKCNLRFRLQMGSVGCRNCSYDLSGLKDSDSCPECSEPITAVSTIE